jgi:hypothetical protein
VLSGSAARPAVRRRTQARLYCTLYPTSDLRPTISPTCQKIIRPTAAPGIKSYLENAIRLEGVHAQTGILPAAHDLAPLTNRACARPQCAVRPEDGAERRRRLEALGGLDVPENFARYGEVVLDRLLVRCMNA